MAGDRDSHSHGGVSGSSPLAPTIRHFPDAAHEAAFRFRGHVNTFATALLNTLPRGIQRRLRDRFEDLRRRRPAAHRALDEYGLAAAQVYPRGTNFDDCLRAGIAEQLAGLVIRKETPVRRPARASRTNSHRTCASADSTTSPRSRTSSRLGELGTGVHHTVGEHRAASRRAFAAARLLIITLGQNEAWVDRVSGLAWARS